MFTNRVFDKVRDDFTRQQTVESLSETAVLNYVRKQTLFLSYARKNGCSLVKSLKAYIKETLPLNVKAEIVDTSSPPRWNSPFCGEGAYPPRSSSQSASNREAQLSVATKVVRSIDLLNHVKT